MDSDHIIVKTPTQEFEVSKKLLQKEETYFAALCRICETKNTFTEVCAKNKINTDCPDWVFILILDYFNTESFEFDHLRSSQKTLLSQYLELYCLHDMILMMVYCYFQKKDIPDEYLAIYREYNKYMIDESLDKDELLINAHYNSSNKCLQLCRENKTIPKVDLIYIYKEQSLCNIMAKQLYKYGTNAWNTKNKFVEKLDFLTYGFISSLKEDDWTGLFAAGGAIYYGLNNVPDQHIGIPGDIDFFLYGLTPEEAEIKIMSFCEKITTFYNNQNEQSRTYNGSIYDNRDDCQQCVYRTPDSITFGFNLTTRRRWGNPFKIQIIYKRLYKTRGEILASFDLDSCQCGYDGSNVYMLPTAKFALTNKINIVGIDKRRESLSYENRLLKYSNRGIAIFVPGLDPLKLKYTMTNIPISKKVGLCKLLHYDHCMNNHVIYKGFSGSTLQARYESNYDILKIPDNTQPIEFANKLWIFNNRPDTKYPMIFIPYNRYHKNEWKKIIDYRILYKQYIDPQHISLYNDIVQQKIDAFNHNPTTIDNGYNDLSSIFTNITEQLTDSLPPVDKTQTEFEFTYGNFGWRRKIKHMNTVKTTIPPWLEFKTVNPGEQMRGFYQKDIGFFTQAYGMDFTHFQFDINRL